MNHTTVEQLKARREFHRKNLAAAKRDELSTYTKAMHKAAWALFECNTTPAELAEIENSAIVYLIVSLYGDAYPLSEDNRRFHRVKDDIIEAWHHIRNGMRNDEIMSA